MKQPVKLFCVLLYFTDAVNRKTNKIVRLWFYCLAIEKIKKIKQTMRLFEGLDD